MAKAKTAPRISAPKSIAVRIPGSIENGVRNDAAVNPVIPTVEPYQRGITVPPFLFRFIPQWNTPSWYEAKRWRQLIRNQPIAMICRETLLATVSAMDWKIIARDTSKIDKYQKEIDYYTQLFMYDGHYDFTDRIELLGEDLLDLPFGAAMETGRENDSPDGKVLWFQALDGGTLFPTLNEDYPVGQYVPLFNVIDPVYFPKHAINRVYLTPRPDIDRVGWGMAPPEKIYLALEMLWRGDQYYANLLLDTPEAGILDLGDMAKDSAEQWVLSFRNLMSGVDPFKIPVLYEHEKPISWIPFGRPPTDLMFDALSMKYAAIIAAGYGLTLNDIGIGDAKGSGGETLAGSIRDERKARRSGRAIFLKKLKNWHDRILPPYLAFNWIDLDEELNQGIARARLGSATAFTQMKDAGFINQQEGRLQLIRDGLFTITMPDKLPEDAQPSQKDAPVGDAGSPTGGNQKPDVVDQIERPVAPSMGGHGDVGSVRKSVVADGKVKEVLRRHFKKVLESATDTRLRRLVRKTLRATLPSIVKSLTMLNDEELLTVNQWFLNALNGAGPDVDGVIEQTMKAVTTYVGTPSDYEDWWMVEPNDQEYQDMQHQYKDWFTGGLAAVMHSLTSHLYENDHVKKPFPPKHPMDMEAPVIASLLMNKAKAMVTDVNNNTMTFLNRALLSAVRKELIAAGMLDMLRQGVDVDAIMSNNSLVSRILADVRGELAQDLDNRLDVIDDNEANNTENQGSVEGMKSLGLTMKQWNHYGNDVPCSNVCEQNIALGPVPLDHEYETVFGLSPYAPGHPACHCKTETVPTDVQRLMETGNFPIQYWNDEGE